jgi:hypothetical protein
MERPDPPDRAEASASSPEPRTDCADVLGSTRPLFRAVSVTVVPQARHLDADGWRELEEGVEQALALQPPARRRQLRLFLRVLDWLPVLRWGRRFRALEPRQRARLLAGLQDARPLLLRRGLWGLRTLVLLGYYTRPEAAAEIGYGASTRGWEAAP